MFPLNVLDLMKLTNLKDYFSDLEVVFQGKPDKELLGICDLDSPIGDNLLFIKNSKFLDKVLESTLPSVGFIISAKLLDRASELEKFSPLFICSCEKIDMAVSVLSKPFYDQKYALKPLSDSIVDPTATIHESASIGKNVVIKKKVVVHPGVVVMDNCLIEEGTVLFPNSTLYPFVEIGRNVRIHAGSVIGADGFGYNFDNGVHHKVWHMGGVRILDEVEIGANSQIDGGTFSPTIIGEGCKIDNNVQIGHNCQLGKGVVICGHVAIGGSSKLGDYTVFGGKSGMGDNMTLGAGCQVAGGALVNCDWPDKTVLGGHPARPLKEWMRGIAYLRKESIKK